MLLSVMAFMLRFWFWNSKPDIHTLHVHIDRQGSHRSWKWIEFHASTWKLLRFWENQYFPGIVFFLIDVLEFSFQYKSKKSYLLKSISEVIFAKSKRKLKHLSILWHSIFRLTVTNYCIHDLKMSRNGPWKWIKKNWKRAWKLSLWVWMNPDTIIYHVAMDTQLTIFPCLHSHLTGRIVFVLEPDYHKTLYNHFLCEGIWNLLILKVKG